MKTVKIYEDGWWCHRINGNDVVEWYPAGTELEIDGDAEKATMPQIEDVMAQIIASPNAAMYPSVETLTVAHKEKRQQRLTYDWAAAEYW